MRHRYKPGEHVIVYPLVGVPWEGVIVEREAICVGYPVDLRSEVCIRSDVRRTAGTYPFSWVRLRDRDRPR